MFLLKSLHGEADRKVPPQPEIFINLNATSLPGVEPGDRAYVTGTGTENGPAPQHCLILLLFVGQVAEKMLLVSYQCFGSGARPFWLELCCEKGATPAQAPALTCV